MTVRLAGPPRLPRGLSRRRLTQYAARLLAVVGQGDAELSLVLVDDATGAVLNARWRGRAGPTDVLAFALGEGAHRGHRGALLGDVVIAIGVARRQADARRHSLESECRRLLIHGVLHLLGYDHARPAEARVMQAKERALWRRLSE